MGLLRNRKTTRQFEKSNVCIGFRPSKYDKYHDEIVELLQRGVTAESIQKILSESHNVKVGTGVNYYIYTRGLRWKEPISMGCSNCKHCFKIASYKQGETKICSKVQKQIDASVKTKPLWCEDWV